MSTIKRKIRRPGEAKSEVVAAIPLACQSEPAAVEFLEKQRWGECPCCPHCGSVQVYQMDNVKTGRRSARFLWRCRDCKKQYTVRVGTIMEDSRIPLKHWCYAFWAACASKKGVSAKQIQRMTGLSYKSALFLMHRIRFAMAPETGTALMGTVEVDETYVGGKPRNKGPHNKRGLGTSKQPVMAMVERGGRVRTRVIADVKAATLKDAIRENVDQSARIMTDEHAGYKGIGAEFEGGHHTTQHGKREYVREGTDIHSNTVEGFFSILKRGIYGVYHNVSRKHLHRYMSEFEFRYNTRGVDDGERLVEALKSGEGKRLMYRYPEQKDVA